MDWTLSLLGPDAALTRGANYSFGLLLDDVSGSTPVPLNLSNYSVSAQLFLDFPGGQLLSTFSVSLPTTTGDPVICNISASATAPLPVPQPDDQGRLLYWVKVLLTRPDGVVLSGGEGPLEIQP